MVHGVFISIRMEESILYFDDQNFALGYIFLCFMAETLKKTKSTDFESTLCD